MFTGLVLVRVTPGKEKQTLEAIKKVKGVTHVSGVFGRWDLVADIEAEDLTTLTTVVVSKIRSIAGAGITSTETLISVEI